MSKIEEYINRWKLCIQINGVSYTIKKTAVRVYNKVIWFHQLPDPVPYKHINNSGQLVEAYDVLIVSGCSPTSAPQCYRYRVQHQREQLEATGLSVKEAYYTNFSPYEITHAGVVLFYRCPYTEAIGMGIKLAKELNKRVVFDIDDLVIDTCYTDMISAIQRLSNKERALYDDGVVRMGATLKLCEYGITTTERLQRELLHYVPEVYINRNCASQMMLFCSERSVLNRKQAQKEKNKDEVIIGYFSGSLTHNADFDLIKEAIIRLLSDYSNVKILLMGEVKLPRDLKKFRRQIIVRPFVDWKKLPDVIASVDINLAPLENTVFNEAKSENKWVEAAIVKVPTVASNVGAFAQVIEDGRTGVLCNDDEWYEKLAELVTDPYKRHTLAENAYLHCKDAYSTVYNAGGSEIFMTQ